MKKYDKRDYLNIFIIITSFLLVYILLLITKNISYSSSIDHPYQHYMIPEYFRTLFYDTKNLIPSFAFNLGMGQNIFNFSYYGLLSPIILISYLFPFIKMKTYLEIISIIIVISSILLFYKWISNKQENKNLRFVLTLLFIMSGPIIFHTHRHIMFINYMPFLLMGLFGVEKYIHNKKILLLIISNVLLITTSYFFSIPGLIVLFIYGIYLYLEKNTNIKTKDFIKNHLLLGWYFILSVLISMTLLLPSLISILENRFKQAEAVSLLTYLVPNINLNQFLYTSYSLGLTSIFILGVVYTFFKKEKHIKFLSIVFSLLIFFPIINYILNGFMYLNGKVLIPFLPLAMLLINITLKDIIENKNIISKKVVLITLIIISLGCIKYSSYSYLIIDVVISLIAIILTNKKKNQLILIIILSIISISNVMRINVNDKFIDNEIIKNQYNTEIRELIKEELNETNIYRTIDLTNNSYNANNIRSINEYKTTMYSSVTNKYYKDFYWNTFDIENINRNDALFVDVQNPLSNIYFANKYLITNNKKEIGYKLLKEKNNLKLYKNEDVFSIGYANKKIMGEEEFNTLKYPYNIEALLNYTIIKNYNNKTNYNSNIINENKQTIFNESINDNYSFELNEKTNKTLKINKDLTNKLLIIKFNMNYSESCSKGDTKITINDITNTLTCKSWKYHNKNYTFTYVLSEFENNELNIILSKGKFNIDDIEIFSLDYDYISSIKKSHDEFIINKEKTKGDIIIGKINVTENSYFNLNIPYDKCYSIYVDNKKVDYELTNKSFIGFKIDKGYHDIKIKYTAPGLKEGKILTIIGLVLLGLTFVVKKGVKNYEKNINDSTLL